MFAAILPLRSWTMGHVHVAGVAALNL